MKTKTESKIPAVRNQYTAQFKEQALERADRDGIITVGANKQKALKFHELLVSALSYR